MRPALPAIPRPGSLWTPFAFWVWAFFAVVAANAIPHLLVQYWFNQSLGFYSLFWTNFGAQAGLFVLAAGLFALATSVPLWRYAVSPTLRGILGQGGVWLGLLAGWMLARHYDAFLLAVYGVPFGTADPVFGHDVGFYVYVLPALRTTMTTLVAAGAVAIAAALIARYDALSAQGGLPNPRLGGRGLVGAFATPLLTGLVCLEGALLAAQAFLGRYALLLKDNADAGVRAGAAYVDVTGVVSSLNQVHVLAVAIAASTVLAGVTLSRLHREHLHPLSGSVAVSAAGTDAPFLSLRMPARAAAAIIALPLAFALAVLVRDFVFVTPNEPHVQRRFIQRHIDATNAAYDLDRVEVHEWAPREQPLSPEALLASRTVQSAPILPSWVSSLEEPPDVQHYERVATSESTLVFGPTLQVYRQHQQLRPYYDFLSVDGVRYTVDGEKRMYASAVRELPSLALVGQKEWLKYWGSAALQFTHGMGLVMSPVNRVSDSGDPTYAVKDVPPQAIDEELAHEPRIYFGEGAKDDYVLTGAASLREFDYATAQSRAEFSYPGELEGGIALSSLLRRAAFAVYTRDFTAFLFSRYIDPARTRVHIRRTPLSRIRAVAPFLFLDSNTYAFVGDRRVQWMVNGLTTSDQYPYSYPEVLGDKADDRAVESFPERVVNYAEDSVKATVDAFSGETHLYQVADDPIVSSWARIYPDLFEPIRAMPGPVQAQLTYPLQWFHVQFDDIYKRYHQRDPIQFYNVEDLWDDADETVGSLGRGLSGFGTGDQMTFSYEGYNALLDPADMPAGVDIGTPGDLQFAMLMPFTPEAARNLRSLVIALQDPDQYGRLISLQVPQGRFVPGPEQIDAYIDNDRPVHQQVTMWIRHASEVIRGSTLLLPVGGDPMYIETVWVNSLQNDLPQLKLVAVRYHDRITSGSTLAQAIGNRELIRPAGPELWALGDSEEREQSQRDGEGGDGERRADGDELAQRDLDSSSAAGFEPDEAGKRADRQEPGAEVAADQGGQERAGLDVGASAQREGVDERHGVVVEHGGP